MQPSQLESVILEEPQPSADTPTESQVVECLSPQPAPLEVAHTRTVGDVFHGFVRHPIKQLIQRWNWKSAVLSSLFRAAIFFFANLAAGWHAAVGALFAELALRAVTSGFYGAITEAFSEARPVWMAMASAMVFLPLANHSLEFLVHWLRGTPKLGVSIGASVIFTACSTSFNVYAMRHGVFTVGGKSRTLGEDMKRILPLLGQFLLAGPRAIVGLIQKGNSSR
jgi:hypothetical protein